jgi:FtsZ-binding cell division protein ZapB
LEKEHQKNIASLRLEIELLKERNQMLLRERDEAVSAREYMEETNVNLQEKLIRIETALEGLREDYEENMRDNIQETSNAREFKRLDA